MNVEREWGETLDQMSQLLRERKTPHEIATAMSLTQGRCSVLLSILSGGSTTTRNALRTGSLPIELAKYLPRLAPPRQGVWVRRLKTAREGGDTKRYRQLRREMVGEARGILKPSQEDKLDLLSRVISEAEGGNRDYLRGLLAGVGFEEGYFGIDEALDVTGDMVRAALDDLPGPPRGSSRLPVVQAVEKLSPVVVD
jgi:hypothetical protein